MGVLGCAAAFCAYEGVLEFFVITLGSGVLGGGVGVLRADAFVNPALPTVGF
jgi:hypothetical protein